MSEIFYLRREVLDLLDPFERIAALEMAASGKIRIIDDRENEYQQNKGQDEAERRDK